MTIVLATGGSLGHIVPALSISECLKKLGHRVVLVGSLRQWKEFIKRYEIEVFDVEIKGGNLRISAMISIIKALYFSYQYYSKIKPDVVVGFGGFGSVVGILTGSLKNIPIVIHEQNVIPGKANKFLSILAKKIAISFRKSKSYFNQNKVVWTGCPSKIINIEREECVEIKRKYEFDKNKPIIFAFGGSQGSKDLNRLFLGSLAYLSEPSKYQVIHIVGNESLVAMQEQYDQLGIGARVFSCVVDMSSLYSIADVIVSRSGALTVTEIAMFKKMAVLIPYPYAGGHQLYNAKVLKEVGLAEIFEGSDEKDLATLIEGQLCKVLDPNVQEYVSKQFKINSHELLTKVILECVKI